MTVGLRTSWLQYPVETITSPRCMKYGSLTVLLSIRHKMASCQEITFKSHGV